MKNTIQHIFFAFACCALLLSSCSKSEDETEQPQTILSTVAGTWLEYAYLNSDGYFTDISGTGYNMYYEFAIPDQFLQYTIDENGEKDVLHKGVWTYSAESQKVHIEEERGWNMDITVEYNNELGNGIYTAVFDIKGRTQVQSSTVKVKRISE